MDDEVKLQLEAWKTTIAVQQHFNDIELKIRGLALTVLTAVLGAAALAVRDGTEVEVFDVDVKLGAAVLTAGLITWLAFYFVDQVWYHRLLLGAVRHGEALEDLLDPRIPGVGLTHSISEASPYHVALGVKRAKVRLILHSSHKLRLFYWVVAILLVVLIVGVQVGSPPPDEPSDSAKRTTSTVPTTVTRTGVPTTAQDTPSSPTRRLRHPVVCTRYLTARRRTGADMSTPPMQSDAAERVARSIFHRP